MPPALTIQPGPKESRHRCSWFWTSNDLSQGNACGFIGRDTETAFPIERTNRTRRKSKFAGWNEPGPANDRCTTTERNGDDYVQKDFSTNLRPGRGLGL